jgi:hypothetical protein
MQRNMSATGKLDAMFIEPADDFIIVKQLNKGLKLSKSPV